MMIVNKKFGATNEKNGKVKFGFTLVAD